MAVPAGATNYIDITSTPASIPATMPDGGVSVFAGDLVIDEAAAVNWEGGAAMFVDGLAADYSDLVVTQSDGETTVPFGIKQFDQTGGTRKLIIGLGLPSLSSAVETVYRLYRGCTGGGFEDRSGVCPTASGFQLYMPLEEAAGNLADWTGNGNDGVRQGTVVVRTGQVANGQGDFVVDTDYVSVTDAPSLNITATLTLMAWINVAGITGDYQVALDKGQSFANGRYTLYIDQNTQRFSSVLRSIASGQLLYDSTYDIAYGVYEHIAMTMDGANVRLYGAGALQNTIPRVGGIDVSTGVDLLLGIDPSGVVQNLNGLVDEVQISDAVRSPDWISTYYNMTSDNDTFWTVGAEESLLGGLPQIKFRIFGRRGPSLAGVS